LKGAAESHVPLCGFKVSLFMNASRVGQQIVAVGALLACLPSPAQLPRDPALVAEAQVEADHRVIAARCGSPAFEKQFYFNSQAAVRAGLVSKRTSPADVEKMITVLRRSPFVLVTVNADCPAQLDRLKQVMKGRSQVAGAQKRR
jgi:hypothetical protein